MAGSGYPGLWEKEQKNTILKVLMKSVAKPSCLVWSRCRTYWLASASFFVKKDILLLILSHFNESFEANESNIRTSLKINLNRSQRMLLVFVETRRSRFFLFAKKDFNYFALGPRPHPATSVILTIQAGLRRLSD